VLLALSRQNVGAYDNVPQFENFYVSSYFISTMHRKTSCSRWCLLSRL